MAEDKKISELSLLTQITDPVYSEVLDTSETDPSLQNKKIPAHFQNTDQALDQGGLNEISAATISLWLNRQAVFAWLYSSSVDPSSTAYMRFGADTGGQRVVFINPTTYGGMLVSEIFTTITTGVYLVFTFNNAGGNIILKTTIPFVNNSGWLQAVCEVVDDNLADTEDAVGILTIIKN